MSENKAREDDKELYQTNVVVYKYANSLRHAIENKLLTIKQMDRLGVIVKRLIEEDRKFDSQYMQKWEKPE